MSKAAVKAKKADETEVKEVKDVKEVKEVKEVRSKEALAKDASLERTIALIEKQYGKGSIMQMDENLYAKIDGIPTGSLSLDIALGGHGIPRGRVAEFFGPESSGKTTLALHVIANAQRLGGVAAFIDAEHALDTTWGKTNRRRYQFASGQPARYRRTGAGYRRNAG